MASQKKPDAGNIFDHIFKPAWLDLVHTLKGDGTAEAKKLAAQAADAAKTAAAAHAEATTTLQATADAVVNPVIDQAVTKLKDVPVIGPVISDPDTANALADMAINSLIGELQKLLTEHPATTPSA